MIVELTDGSGLNESKTPHVDAAPKSEKLTDLVTVALQHIKVVD